MVLSTARRDNDQVMREVLEIANRYEIAPEHVQTDYINIEPRYSDGEHLQKNFSGYFMRKTVVIRLKDISQFESLYSDVLESGVNYIHGVEFRTFLNYANIVIKRVLWRSRPLQKRQPLWLVN